MELQKLCPRTPGQRHYKKFKKQLLSRQSFLTRLLVSRVKNCVGRSSQTGHITVQNRGAGNKRLYRHIAFTSQNTLGLVLGISYDPNRNCFISFCFNFLTNKFFFQLAVQNQPIGSIYSSFKFLNSTAFLGSRNMLQFFSAGALLHCVAKKNYMQFSRSAGTYCTLLDCGYSKCKLRLPSGQVIDVDLTASATVGIVSNISDRETCIGKAGRRRHHGRRPHVRGIAKNPVDHPHGGRTNGGRPSVTPWARPTHGQKTSRSRVVKVVMEN